MQSVQQSNIVQVLFGKGAILSGRRLGLKGSSDPEEGPRGPRAAWHLLETLFQKPGRISPGLHEAELNSNLREILDSSNFP